MNIPKLKKSLPITPGVYFMKNAAGKILYVGKAGNLKRRVMSYFERPHDFRISRMVSEIARVDYEQTDTVIEALILEARMIKKYQPQYNVLEKDDSSFIYVVIPREEFPRVLLMREKETLSYNKPLGKFGPFTSPASLRVAMRVLRRIFPWSTHEAQPSLRGSRPGRLTKQSRSNVRLPRVSPAGESLAMTSFGTDKRRPCFDYQIGLCPGTCAGKITRREYLKTIRALIALFNGKKQKILRAWKSDMKKLAKETRFEEAAELRRRISGLEHIKDIALLKEKEIFKHDTFRRVEGYDISNISGTSAVGSMVVFTDGTADKNQYRKFRIKTVKGSNDTAMLAEVLRRRFSRHNKTSVIAIRQQAEKQSYINEREIASSADSDRLPRNDGSWPLPDLVLIDGGLPQVNAARLALSALRLAIPVVGIAKGPERKRNDFLYPPELHAIIAKNRDMLIRVRDEAHRFAVKYHRELRSRLSS